METEPERWVAEIPRVFAEWCVEARDEWAMADRFIRSPTHENLTAAVSVFEAWTGRDYSDLADFVDVATVRRWS